MNDLLLAMGVPSAIFTTFLGLIVWWFKRDIEKRDKQAEEREAKRQAELDEKERKRNAIAEERDKNYEKIMLMIMQTGRASFVLAKATAMAVQRIPDAKCNGDMTSALRKAEEIQKEEQDFLINAGVQHLFGNEHDHE